MKKILLVLGLLAIVANPVFAITDIEDIRIGHALYSKDKKVKVDQKLISAVGFRLLNANRINKRIVFHYSRKNTVNALTTYSGRNVIVYDGIISYMEREDELAAVMAHEISHGIDYYDGIFRGSLSFVPQLFVPRKYEHKADLRAIDFLVNAGYNPLAMIIIMNKFASQDRYEIFSTHPLTSRRLALMYEYIYTKYPAFLADNEYIDNIYYQNFLLNSESNRKKLEQKVKTKSTKKVRYD